MCSIGGYISEKPLDRTTARNLLSALLWYGQDRGTQSAGCYYNGQIAKRAMSPADFLDSSDFFNLFNANGTLGLTHTRMATSGGHGDDQAQPFSIGRTTTVHNGMFWDVKGLKRDWNITKPSGVDSELITSFLHAMGPKKLPDFIESTDGPSAIAAIHNDKLYLMRHGNPTWFYHLEVANENHILVFASTDEQLERAMRHTWLMHDPIHTNGTQQGVLLHATPRKLSAASRKITPNYSMHGYTCYGELDHGNRLWKSYLYDEAKSASDRIRLAASYDKTE